jgi:hypothetical protein
MTYRSATAAFIAAVLLTACGGGAPTRSAPAPTAPPQSEAKQALTIHIDAPTAPTSATRRTPRYLSQATTQIGIDVRQNGNSITGYPTTVALTPTSNGCTSSLASTQCTLTIALAAGGYTVSVQAKDSAGTTLSSAQAIPVTIVSGATNSLSLVMAGVPARITAARIPGTLDEIAVESYDADNNLIVGLGAPQFTIAKTGGSINLTITQPAATSPNVFTAVPANAGTATLTLTATYPQGVTNACALSGSVCTATIAVGAEQDVFAATTGHGEVFGFPLPFDGGNIQPDVAFTRPEIAGAQSITFAPSGMMFVATQTAVVGFAPPYGGPPAVTITTGLSSPGNVAVRADGALFVGDYGQEAVLEYLPPYTGVPAATIPMPSNSLGPAIAIDASGDLFVENSAANSMAEYAPPYTAAPIHTVVVSGAAPLGAAIASNGNLVVMTYGGSVQQYAPPFTGAAVSTLSVGFDTAGFAVDSSGNVIVANTDTNVLNAYAPPYTGSPTILTTLQMTLGDEGAVDTVGPLAIPPNYVLSVSQ